MMDLLLVGLVSILGQAVLLRELNVAFFGVDLIYALSLGFWLIWTALGALIGRRNLSPGRNRVHLLFLLFSVLLPIDLVFVRGARIIASGIPGAYLSFPQQLIIMNLALLPIGLLSGTLFQWAAKIYLARGRTLAAAYALESAGGFAGGMCATLFLMSGIQNLLIALICSMLALCTILTAQAKTGQWLRAASIAALLLLALLLWFAAPVDGAMTAWTRPGLLASRDTPYGRVTVTRQEGQIAVYENGALSFETEGTDAEEFVHMAALLHPQPRQVLIMGGGIAGTVREILKHAPERIDYVELNAGLLHIVAPTLPQDLQDSLKAPSVRTIVEDPRRFLGRPGNYDLILIGMPEPESGQTNRYYTLEFFRQCAARLNRDGIVSFRLRSAENLWTPQQTSRAVSIYRALKAVLPEVQVLPGGTNTFAASRQPLLREPDLLAARLAERRIKARLVSGPYIRYSYENQRFERIAQTLASGRAPENTDARPVCYQYTVMIWLSKFYPDLASWNLSSPDSRSATNRYALWAGAIAVSILLLLSRRFPPFCRALTAGLAGFAGMILETVLILHYQVRSGVLYQDIGILLMSFMAGLALGALAVDIWFTRRAGEIPLWSGPLIAAGFSILSLATAARVGAASSGGLLETAGTLAAAGIAVSAVFAYASAMGSRDQRQVVAPLYAADLIGGGIGSLAGSLVLIPMAGLKATVAFMAPLALLFALLVRVKR